MRVSFAVAVIILGTLVPLSPSAAENDASGGTVLRGKAALGGWTESAPGVRRLIRPEDLPAPFATTSSSNAPAQVAMPDHPQLILPPGFRATLVARGYQQPRVIRTAPNGDLFLVDSAAGTIHVLRFSGNSDAPGDSIYASGLNQPYGIAFYPAGPNPRRVYVANTDSIVRFAYANGDRTARGAPETIVASLPAGGHWTRDLAFSADGSRMLVAVGSNSNVAEEVKDPPDGGIANWAAAHPLGAMWGAESERAGVLSFTPEGGDRRVFATGLRNCSGLAVEPITGQPWCVTNERDQLGDNIPPDFATHIEEGAFYGWPWSYTGNYQDPRVPPPVQRPDLAGKATIPDVLIQAHSAPLGIAFYTGTMFPQEYRGDAFVTLHGSWNRGARTGYKVVRLILKDGHPTGEYVDFATGFALSADAVWGRPVGVAVGGDGALFITEDGNGTVWRISYDPAQR